MVEKTSKMPILVYLAFSAIHTRKGAWRLIGASAIFTFYCVPWSELFARPDWLGKVFLIDDWSWLAMMVPMTLWYWLSLRWIDKNSGWAEK